MMHGMRKGLWSPLLFVIFFAAICHIALGQATTGSILGSATDSTGAVIRGGKPSPRRTRKRASRSTRSPMGLATIRCSTSRRENIP